MSGPMLATLLLLLTIPSYEAAECSQMAPCSGGECCSKYGYCGNTADHCGDGCQSNCKVKPTACDAVRQCENKLCCSQMGFCGNTAEHCGAGCLSNCWTKSDPTTTAPKGNCDSNRKCPDNQCCSQYGFCGDTVDHCGKGCLSNCWENDFSTPPTLVGHCDSIRKCPNDLCCSQYKFCGKEADHCGTGCLSNCWNNVSLTTADPNTAFCSATNPCPDRTCCSKYGYCGTTADHCGPGCRADCHNGDSTSNSLGKPFQSVTSCKLLDAKKQIQIQSSAWLCDGCPYLTWNTAPNISLTSNPSFLLTTNDLSQCFYACLQRDCVVFTLDLENQTCSIYEEYGSWSLTSELIFVTSYFKKIESTVLLDEWIFSQPSSIDGTPFYSEILEGGSRTFAGCLFLCMFRFRNSNCRGIDFSIESGQCRLFNGNEAAVTKIKTKMGVVQHISVLRQDDNWRFQSLQGKKFAAIPYLMLSSISIDDCLGECMEDWRCQGATIQGRGINRDCNLVNDTSGDWEIAVGQVTSYLLQVPAAEESQHPVAAEYSPMIFWNTDESYIISRKQNVPTIAECINMINTTNFDGVSKITYIDKTKECVLLPDWAQITESLEVSDSPIHSYIVQAKRQWQYYGYKRVPGLYAPGVRIPQVFPKQFSVDKCLDTCLEGHTCSAVVAIYNNTENQLYCYYYTDIDLKNVNLTVHPSSEMFYKLEMARLYSLSSSNPVDMCAFGGDVEQTPSSLSTLLQLNQTVWDIDELFPDTLNIAPHGETFGGIPIDGSDPEANASLSTFKSRRRSAPEDPFVHERHRRSFFGDLWKGIKKVGGAIVEGVKTVGKVIKKGVETVLKPIDDLIKPVTDWVGKNIVNPIMEHVVDPILQPVKDLIEPVAGPVLDFVDSILPDSTTFDILTGGSIRKGLLKNKKKTKGKTDTPDKDVKKKVDEENKNKRDSDNNRCERAQKRKNNCQNNKRDECIGPRIKNAGKTYKSCTGKKNNQKCDLECQDGYQPSSNKLTCKVPSKGQPFWEPRTAKCEEESCKDLPFIQVRPMGQKNSKFPIYLVKYQKSKKIPLWSMYYHTGSIGNVPNAPKAFRQYPCNELKGFQLGNTDYRKSGYDRGHLAPQNAFRLDPRSNTATNLYINVAPQDPWTNQNPWKNLESKVESHVGVIVTGVCSSGLSTAKTRKVPVPKCYWKLVCTRNKQGKHTAAAFYHDNTAPKSQNDKKKRNDQVAKPLNQIDVKNFIGAGEYGQIWTSATKYLPINLRGKRALTDGVVNPVECAAQQTLSEEDRLFWAAMIDVNSWNTDWNDPNDEDVDDDDDEANELDEEQLDLDGCDDSCNNAPTCGRKVIGYYTSWGKNLLRVKQASYLTHVIYAFIEMKADGSLLVGSADPVNTQDYDKDSKLARARLEHLVRLKKAVGGHLKTLFAVGGWENSQYYSSVAANDGLTSNFIKSAMDIMLRYDFDGIDIDWEYPVTGGAHDGTTNDKQNYVKFLKAIRSNLNYLQAKTGRSDPYLITIASAAGSWVLEVGYDLEQIIQIVDWINVMTYDYYGAWTSKWGAYTGPVAPLFFGTPDRYSGKMNVDFTMKFYVCRTEMSQKIVMGLAFYGRYWNNVGAQVKSGDDLWRMSEPISGGFASYRDIKQEWLGKPGYQQQFHEATKTPFLWSESERSLMAYENEKSLQEKVKYAASHNLGGVMIWAVDLDDDDMNLLRSVSSDAICGGGGAAAYKCNPLHEKRWWTPENDEKENAGMCGQMAPLYEGYYPLCDPDDPGYSCCGKWGYCGKGPDFCDCPECVNYGEEPSKTLDEPIKPTRSVQWHFLNADIPVGQPRCGPNAPKLNGKYAICNPDSFFYCCSSGGYCGNSDEFCKCDGCINFKENPNYEYPE